MPLFNTGSTPADAIKFQQLQQQAQVDPSLFQQQPQFAGGLALGRAFGAAIAGRFGPPSPEVQAALKGERRLQALAQFARTKGIDPSNPENMNALATLGLSEGDLEVAALAMNARVAFAKANKPGDGLTNDIKNYQLSVQQDIAAGRTPKTFGEFQLDLKRASAMVVRNEPRSESVIAAEVRAAKETNVAEIDKNFIERANKEHQEAKIPQRINDSQKLMGLLESGTPTGLGETQLKSAKRLLISFGMLDEEQAKTVEKQEIFEKLSLASAYQLRADAMPGQLSDAEGRNLQKMVSSLSGQPGSNKIFLQLRISDDEFKQKMNRDMNNWFRKNKGDLDGWLEFADKQWAGHFRQSQILVQEFAKTAQPQAPGVVTDPQGGQWKVRVVP